ncbi:hypothetical protein KL942_000925 [Ogataea angusta]|uniref:Extradiol ring-cleavage dioxygenase class III enzyme subunit B domain-containing protein n=1 Tax=Pichia angusta TaxID=870730 RepID=A0AAN6DJ19_PICAN|nr:uncharacterized protein KL928_000534 [Ogataea angusta]KAG7822059.1 hypothetical protein KL928_000534 [Ogataea angusta]KAG7831408.1 hypothetical protein KL920_000928 [Ogataea angusta]KAG7837350.1 hypothetical protein KL943_001389 [Ogataea angusta]KAG7842187.1 hypothetical protein KL942_000925 [Ogataea angusta]KAG7852018.1 hypothetical protein KL940_000900 [Ogataea angusta]
MLPVYFISHGGPTFADRGHAGSEAGAWDTVRQLGPQIVSSKPDYVICVSAHWETANDVLVSSIEGENPLVYDFYNFPRKYYETKFHTLGSPAFAKEIVQTLRDKGIPAAVDSRGLDHGVWTPLRVAFGNPDVQDTKRLDLETPLIQVSLPPSPKIIDSYRLGEALSDLRAKNVAIVCSGMSVHNLQDMRRAMSSTDEPLPYVKPFNSWLTNTLTQDNSLSGLQKLETDPQLNRLYRAAHPTPEHFLPLAVALGAARAGKCEVLHTAATYSLGWNIYKFI